jgi:hypothetical protein
MLSSADMVMESEIGSSVNLPRAGDGAHRGFLPAGNLTAFNFKFISKTSFAAQGRQKEEAEV